MKGKTVFVWAGVLLAIALLGLGGAAAFVYSGVYDIAARRPHTRPVAGLLKKVQQRSVAAHARRIEVPRLDDEELIRGGLVLYRTHCVMCHGGPGEARARVGVGLNPNPPPLLDAVTRWTPAEIYWITFNGLKMAGMPAFGIGKTADEIWAITAFVQRMSTLSPAEYRRMVDAAEGRSPAGETVRWLAPADVGWETLAADGDADRGRRLTAELGCATCHTIPGVPGARSWVGPPLNGWARRHFIAGHVTNVPVELVRWLRSPREVRPGTAMPDVGMTEADAWHIARFLYTLR
jgi:mono/diheme cytochrome c family protein